MKKRILLFALVVITITCLAAVTVNAETYTGTCGTNLAWTLDTETGVLDITGEGDMSYWTSSSSVPWYSYRTNIITVNIGDSVTSIGNYAFYGCTGLMSADVGDNVISIGDYAFKDCTSLTSVDIGDSVTSIGRYAFRDCTSLTSVDIPDSVTSIGSAAFYGCTGLMSADIGDNVTSIDDSVFSRCTGLTNVNIGDSVTSIGYYAFYNCNNLTSVDVPDGVTYIGGSAFTGCDNLSSVDIGESVTSIGENAFNMCYRLKSVNITDIAAWCQIKFADYDSNPLYYANNLYINGELAADIEIPDSVTSIGNYVFDGCSSMTSVDIPEGVTSIGNNAFSGCDSLTSVDIPEGVTSIGNYAFSGCDSLTSIDIPDGVTSIGSYMFSSSDSLTSVHIGDGVTSIGDYVFGYCNSLTSVDIGSGVTTISNLAFLYSPSISSITVDEANANYSNDEYGVLFNKKKTTIQQYPIGNARTSYTIPDSVTSIGENAFRDCEILTSVSIPISLTEIVTAAFLDCSSLNDIYYDGVQSQWVKIQIGTHNTGFNEATVHYNGISVTDVTLDKSSMTLLEGASEQLVATVNPYNAADKSVSWSSSNNAVATVSNGVVTAISAGEATITVITADGGHTAECTVTVTAPPTHLTRDTVLVLDDSGSMYGTPLTELKSAAVKFCEIVLAANGYNRIAIVIYSNGVSYCDFTNDISILKTKINSMIGSGGTNTGDALIKANDLLVISDADIKSAVLMTDGQPNSTSAVYTAANTLKQNAYLYTLGFFHSSKSETAITLLKDIQNAGYYEVTDGDQLDIDFSDIANNITRIPVTEFSIDKSELVLTAGESAVINYVIKPHDATNQTVFWTSSNESVATVANGIVNAISEGKVTITAQTSDGGFAEECTVIVNSAESWYYTYTVSDNKVTITGTRPGLLSEIVIPSYIQNYPVTAIDQWAFSGTEFTEITIPDIVTSIGEYAFYNCDSLTSVNIPGSITSMGKYAFWSCSNLTNVDIGFGVTSIGAAMFDGCTSLTSVDIPDSVTSIGDLAFYGCTSLASMDIPSSVTFIGNQAFNDCTSLTSIFIPESVTSMYDNVFQRCTGLTSITVDKANTEYSSDEYGVLFDKNRTKLIQYPIGNTRTSYTIPDSVTSLAWYAFGWCDSLKRVVIPDSVTNFGIGVFYSSLNLTIYGYTGSEAETYANDNNIPFVALDGISVPGDADGDGKVEAVDLLNLQRAIAGWDGYDVPDTAALDLDGDGEVGSIDAIVLTRHLANWVGYETLPYVSGK